MRLLNSGSTLLPVSAGSSKGLHGRRPPPDPGGDSAPEVPALVVPHATVSAHWGTVVKRDPGCCDIVLSVPRVLVQPLGAK